MDRNLGAIFDMDGVLVDSAEAHWHAWRLLGEEVGREHTRELFDRTFGMHNREIIPLWLGPGVSPEELERMSLWKEAKYREVAAETLRPLDGAVELVRALSADGFLLAVGSSGPPANVELALKVLGVADAFHAISCGQDVAEGKPHPEVFLKAAAKLRLEPASCVVIEDAPQGVEAGLRAGASVIAVTSTRRAEELRGAHRIVGSLRELTPGSIRSLILSRATGPVGGRA